MKKWYAVQTYSNKENNVKKALETKMETMNLKEKIYQVLVPEEKFEVIDKRGNVKEGTNKLYPGYVFLEMEVEKDIDDNTWFIVRNTENVTGFLGSSGGGKKPVAIPQDEMNRVLQKIGKIQKEEVNIHVHDKVRIISGSFLGQEAVVSSVDVEKNTVVVEIQLFGGRTTPSTFFLDEVEKIN